MKLEEKAEMIHSEEVKVQIGYAIGGACPFEIKEGVRVYKEFIFAEDRKRNKGGN